MSSSSKDAFDTGVFRALADFGFERFATPKLLRVLYIIGFVVVLFYGIGFLVGGLIQGGGLAFMALIGVPLGVLALSRRSSRVVANGIIPRPPSSARRHHVPGPPHRDPGW